MFVIEDMQVTLKTFKIWQKRNDDEVEYRMAAWSLRDTICLVRL